MTVKEFTSAQSEFTIDPVTFNIISGNGDIEKFTVENYNEFANRKILSWQYCHAFNGIDLYVED